VAAHADLGRHDALGLHSLDPGAPRLLQLPRRAVASPRSHHLFTSGGISVELGRVAILDALPSPGVPSKAIRTSWRPFMYSRVSGHVRWAATSRALRTFRPHGMKRTVCRCCEMRLALRHLALVDLTRRPALRALRPDVDNHPGQVANDVIASPGESADVES
jgi:hypothetical protein